MNRRTRSTKKERTNNAKEWIWNKNAKFSDFKNLEQEINLKKFEYSFGFQNPNAKKTQITTSYNKNNYETSHYDQKQKTIATKATNSTPPKNKK